MPLSNMYSNKAYMTEGNSMSFKLNNSQQLTLHDSFINLPARSQKMLMKSWCRDFAEIVFPAINEERFAVLYSDRKFSRPNTPVNFIVGALILKAEHNLNDDELIESICFDVRYQYALHTTHLEEQPVSDRTFASPNTTTASSRRRAARRMSESSRSAQGLVSGTFRPPFQFPPLGARAPALDRA